MNGEPRFFCDDHLRRLARWLRAAGYDTGGGDSSTYRPTSSCSALPGIQSIDWVLPALLLGAIAARRRLGSLFLVLREALARRRSSPAAA